MTQTLFYDCIIIGAGASGLFCAAGAPAGGMTGQETEKETAKAPGKGLILESTDSPGKKLLLSGSGQCNITHGGSIKDFISHYGENGRKIRSALYRFNNLALADFFQSRGVPLREREDGKVFPKSMKASDILDALLTASAENGYTLLTNRKVHSIDRREDGTFLVNEKYQTGKLVIAAGGCSVPATGSDGSIFPIFEKMGLLLTERTPTLVPVYVQDYPYASLSGISFPGARVSLGKHVLRDDVLLTHRGFSGPAVLNLSRYGKTGETLRINYLPDGLPEFAVSGNRRQAAPYFTEVLGLPRRFVDVLLDRAGIGGSQTVASLSGKKLKAFEGLLISDTFSVSGTGGFSAAMATGGGISLSEMDLKTFQCKNFPGLFIIGETLDIDGDTGGYNLQFAFSSGFSAAQAAVK